MSPLLKNEKHTENSYNMLNGKFFLGNYWTSASAVENRRGNNIGYKRNYIKHRRFVERPTMACRIVLEKESYSIVSKRDTSMFKGNSGDRSSTYLGPSSRMLSFASQWPISTLASSDWSCSIPATKPPAKASLYFGLANVLSTSSGFARVEEDASRSELTQHH